MRVLSDLIDGVIDLVWSVIWLFSAKIWCKHNYIFMRNIYGDEINFRSGKRSEWRCFGCGHFKYKDELVKEA